MGRSELLAFVHVEKAAGTTLIHILRYNFFLRRLDVRPLFKASDCTFGRRDLRVAMRVNPGLRCVAGHSIKAFSGLEADGRRVRYVTILRDPIKRYLSQFQYTVEQRNEGHSFEQFLRNDWFTNFQTRKFSRTGDLDEAKQVLAEQMSLVGTSDRFDEFLVMLKRQLEPFPFDPTYRDKNLAKNTLPLDELLLRHRDDIYERNSKDLDLYRFAVEELRPRFAAEFGSDLESQVAAFRFANSACASRTGARLRPYVDYVFRRFYLMPVTGLVRMRHGLPAAGSY
jgi:hypothetical protein